MLTGFVIGLPSLLWVFVFLGAIVYVMAIIFRISLGPAVGQDLMATCGAHDKVDDLLDPAQPNGNRPTYDYCKAHMHYLFGEEYFPTVTSSVLTTFRCMIGDCSTRVGTPLAIPLSDGYGLRFTITYMALMCSAMFGVFNIITAIFVESTISGLRHTNQRSKYQTIYTSKFVRNKLKDLLHRIGQVAEVLPHSEPAEDATWDLNLASDPLGQDHFTEEEEEAEEQRFNIDGRLNGLELTRSQFTKVMADASVMRLLAELDVQNAHPDTLLDTFDPDRDGLISLNDFATAVLNLRGEPQKHDIIAAQASLRLLHNKVEQLQALVVDKIGKIDGST